MKKRLVTGVVYLLIDPATHPGHGGWLLGDAVVTGTHFTFRGPDAQTRFSIRLGAVAEVRTIPFFYAEFEAHVFDIRMKSGDAVRFRALDSFQQRDFADTMDDIAAGFYPHHMPPFQTIDHTPSAADREKLPTQVSRHVDQMAAAKRRLPLPVLPVAHRMTQLPALPRAPRVVSLR